LATKTKIVGIKRRKREGSTNKKRRGCDEGKQK
jgi:hypothetical protein